MVVFQVYNKKIKAYVKMSKVKGKTKILNVKQINPKKPFKGIMKKWGIISLFYLYQNQKVFK